MPITQDFLGEAIPKLRRAGISGDDIFQPLLFKVFE
jgi:hypothetical protein